MKAIIAVDAAARGVALLGAAGMSCVARFASVTMQRITLAVVRHV
jgi:hypothetical protein